MKIQEVYESELKNNQLRRRTMKSLPKMKPPLIMVAMTIMCIASYYFGSHINQDRVEKLEGQIESIKSTFRQNKYVRKRDVVNAIGRKHHVMKRNARDAQPVITSLGSGGATYTRWGRRGCPDQSQTNLVYEGVAAGGYYTHYGGGSNMLCLDQNVSYTAGKYVDGNQGSARIYGVEYRDGAWADPLFDLSLIEEGNFRQHNVPCAVCITRARYNQLMIPGRDVCPVGWTIEYTGYVMSTAHGHQHSSSYLCVDGTPQVVRGSGGDQGGSLLYIVETQCPSLQCEPFVLGRELRCVVCTI